MSVGMPCSTSRARSRSAARGSVRSGDMSSPDGSQSDPGFSATLPAQSGLASGDTVADPSSSLSVPVLRRALPGYRIGALIGRGGMGEVVAAHDEEIGRDVAIKRMLRATPSAEAVSRFLREARIQARLEHPAIVPVHDLGHDASGQPFFTMKKLVGVTLAEMLATMPRQRLLRAFAEVCRAVAFAHSRGVIHRDLKPANIMLGDFGEVYVLDWGLARVLADAEGGAVAHDIGSLDGSGGASGDAGAEESSMTKAGALLGTPGYMSPEQIRAANAVGTPTDVFALGAILFEILAGEPLHPPGAAALQSTVLELANPSASQRAPAQNPPPELEALCAVAVAADPTVRPSASELAEKVERYLDGDRDVARRVELAAEWLAKAHAALAADAIGRRAEAMRHAGHALALDPESGSAAELVTRLMLEPAQALPAELRSELAASESRVQQRQARVAMASFGGIAIVLALAAWNGLRSPAWLGLIAALAGVLTVVAYTLSRRRASRTEMLLVAIGNATLAALVSRMFGSLIVAPATTCIMAVSLTSYPQLIDRAKLVVGILLASWCLPVVLERVGVLGRTWEIEGEQLVSTSAVFELGGTSTAALVIATNLVSIVVIGLFANALARSRRDAQQQVEIQAWHLRQLLPVVGT